MFFFRPLPSSVSISSDQKQRTLEATGTCLRETSPHVPPTSCLLDRHTLAGGRVIQGIHTHTEVCAGAEQQHLLTAERDVHRPSPPVFSLGHPALNFLLGPHYHIYITNFCLRLISDCVLSRPFLSVSASDIHASCFYFGLGQQQVPGR